MTTCACAFDGDLTTIDHRRHHRAWERDRTGHTVPEVTEATTVEVTDIMVTLDQLIAHAHGGPPPDLTAGAQAILATARVRT
jgi:hypothetical protein